MTLNNNTRKYHWINLLATILSGLLLANAHSLHPTAWLAWFAPIPLLWVVYRCDSKRAFLYGFIAGLLASLSLFNYLSGLANISATLGLSLLRAVQYGLIAWLSSIAFHKFPIILGMLTFPAISAALDYVITLFSPHGSGGSIAYSQMNFLPTLQLASVGGTVLITFLLTIFASVLTNIIVKGRKALPQALMISILLLGLNYYGYQRMTPSVSGKELQIGMLASDKYEGVPEDWRPIWQDYRHALIDLVQEDELDIILLPEKLFIITENDREELLTDLQSLATELDLAIVIGLDERENALAYNRAYFVEPGNNVSLYDKIHMIPGAEGHFAIGDEPLILDYKGVRIGLAICKDLDFPQTIRVYGQADIDLMLVPAWDFYEDDWFHSRMAMMRGVENGFAVARSARRGFMNFSDVNGEVLAEIESSDNMANLIYNASVNHRPTLYSQVGDVFGWLVLIYSLFSLFFSLRRNKVKML